VSGSPTRHEVYVLAIDSGERRGDDLQPDLCHAGGITEVRLIAGMAEA